MQWNWREREEGRVGKHRDQATQAPRQERPAQNRSLERGLEILRGFRPGVDLMGNGEIAENTGIARATVSRLTQTLARAGMLEYDPAARAYRLGAATLSLALAMRSSNPVLVVASPLMRAASEKFRANAGLATADRDEMVYLESFRYNRRSVLRTIVSGQRVPMELTSLGLAYLAVASDERRREFLSRLRARGTAKFNIAERQILLACNRLREVGFCEASWQPEVVAIAAPIVLPSLSIYVVNMSVSTTEPLESVVAELRGPLLKLRDAIRAALFAKLSP